MPELPDILLYLHALRPRVVGRRVVRVRLASPFLLRSIEPPLAAIEGRAIVDLHRLGKRIVFEAERELFLVFHLMIAGRFRWKPAGVKIPGKLGQLAIDFEEASLLLTEAGTKHQASLHVVEGREALARHDPGGLEIMDIDLAAFGEALRRENHTRSCSAASGTHTPMRYCTPHACPRSSRQRRSMMKRSRASSRRHARR
jgi:formamidopyrimidine-DNA glycosylase